MAFERMCTFCMSYLNNFVFMNYINFQQFNAILSEEKETFFYLLFSASNLRCVYLTWTKFQLFVFK